jgi:nucleoside-diphosphate-sugar epimerase
MTTGDFSRAPDAGRRVVLVTGATGFVGRAVLERLRTEAVIVRGVVRDATRALPDDVQRVVVRDVVDVDRADVAQGTDCVVHLAARVHMMRAASADPLREFRRVNVDGTLRLARAAAEAGARRFVFVSSIKVNGESGHFTAGDTPAPVDPYGVSKHEAEIGLRAVARETGMEVVVRPPLVYGPGVRAHFLSLMRIVDSGLPLPVGAIENRRSMVFVANLADFSCTCMYAPAAANETFLVSDGVDLSTPDIVRRIAHGLGKPARLLPIPPAILRAIGTMAGKRAALQRLMASLQVDTTAARTRLGWPPPFTVDEETRLTTQVFQHARRGPLARRARRQRRAGPAMRRRRPDSAPSDSAMYEASSNRFWFTDRE